MDHSKKCFASVLLIARVLCGSSRAEVSPDLLCLCPGVYTLCLVTHLDLDEHLFINNFGTNEVFLSIILAGVPLSKLASHWIWTTMKCFASVLLIKSVIWIISNGIFSPDLLCLCIGCVWLSIWTRISIFLSLKCF